LKLSPWFALILSTLAISIYAVAVLLTGPYAWDDGAITVAFSRTLALEGEFALTSVSERVEGTSSLLYTFAMAVPFMVADLSFLQSIYLSQYLALLLLIINLAVINAYVKPKLVDPGSRYLLLFLFLLVPMLLAEILNGMEMISAALLMSLFLVFYQQRSAKIYPVLIALLLCRFEFVFYLGSAISMTWILDPATRRYNFGLGVFVGFAFIVISALRFTYFGDIMPNTIWAKMHPPYSGNLDLVGTIRAKIDGGIGFVRIHFAFFLLLSAILVLTRNKRFLGDIKTWLIVSYLIFALITGENGGYAGRMYVGVLPVFLFLLVDALQDTPQTRQSTFGLAALALCATVLVNFELAKQNLWLIAKGAYHQNFLPKSLAAHISERFPPNSLGASPENYRRTGDSVNKLRQHIGLSAIRFMAPDVGGLALCCEPAAIEIIDAALLANSQLAHQGYQVFERQLVEKSPHIIAIHAMWAEESGVYNSKVFHSNFLPIVFENTLFWITSDLFKILKSQKMLQFKSAAEPFDFGGLRNDLRRADLNYIQQWRAAEKSIFVIHEIETKE